MSENSKYEYRAKMSERMLEFAVNVMKLERNMVKAYSGKHIYRQLFRAVTSSGANFEESIAAAKQN